jgi:hypothetical protein
MLTSDAAGLCDYSKFQFATSPNWISGQQKEPGDTKAEGRTAVGLAVGELEDAEEDGAVPAESELFALDADLVLDKDAIEHVDQLDVGNGLEGRRHFGRGQHLKLGAGDDIGVNVGHELGVLPGYSPLWLVGFARRRREAERLSTNYLQIRVFRAE